MREVVEKFSVTVGGYQWTTFAVYRHPREAGKYVVSDQGGCSCNSFEQPTLKQLESEQPLGKREVYAEFSEWWNSAKFYREDYCEGTKIDNMERLRASL